MRNFLIKTKIVFLVLAMLCYKAQDNSISASVNTPVSYQTGVPDISFPLVSLSATKDFTLYFGLNYNPNAYKPAEYCGQIARNWMLSGSNFTITRKVISDYIDESNPSWVEWDDIYYYNLNGEQGSFKFLKDGIFPNDLHIKKLTPSNLIIEFERVSTTSTWQDRPVNFFKITDSKGYKYFFTDHDSQKIIVPGANGSHPQFEMRNTFYISNIADANGKNVAIFNNKKFIKYASNGSSVIDGVTYLPQNIVTDYGKILIEHGDGGDAWNFHDRYYFKNFTLIDHHGNFISKKELIINNSSYKYFDIDLFQSLEAQTIQVRNLGRLKSVDKNTTVIGDIIFNYTYSPPSPRTWGSLAPAWTYQKSDFLMNGLLATVKFSSGAKTEYNFGIHTLKSESQIDYNTPSYINQIQSLYTGETSPFSFKQKTDSIAFDSHVTKKYYLNNLQKYPNSRIYVKFFKDEIYPWDSGPQPETKGPPLPAPKLSYKVKNYNNGNFSGEIDDLYSPYAYVVPANGTAYLEITGSGGKGWFEIYEKFWSEPPYVLLNQNAMSDTGVKIQEIKYYDRAQNSIIKTINFNYDLFNEPGVSSGISLPDYRNEVILYKNIKVFESDKPGYIKYYYKTSHDFPKYTHPDIVNAVIWPNFNLTNKGLLDKKEICDINNSKISSTTFDYILPVYDPTKLYYFCDGATGPIYSHESFPEKVKATETSYDSTGNFLSITSEKYFNQDNNNLMKDKKITADGIIMETEYQYAAEKNNTKLIGASMSSVPLEVTQKQNNNLIGKIETLYDHAGNYFPSAVKSSGISGYVINEEKNDIYDTMGNVLQSSTKTGVSTAYIYGYNSTLLIAKIVGAKYEDVMSAFGQPATIEAYKNLEIYAKSNYDINDSSEELLRQNLDEFRLMNAFKNYQVTTYTYDPLIGIKSVTSASGNKEYYFYDTANRVIRVEDINHNVIKENKYLQNLNN